MSEWQGRRQSLRQVLAKSLHDIRGGAADKPGPYSPTRSIGDIPGATSRSVGPNNLLRGDRPRPLEDASCHGRCLLFSKKPGDAKLIGEEINARINLHRKMDFLRYWIECTSMQGFGRACKEDMCVYRILGDVNMGWALGVVQCYNPIYGSISLFEWNGDEAAFDCATNWNEQGKYFKLVKLALADIDLRWVNQVSGRLPGGEWASSETRCSKDGGIQCKGDGPDSWPARVPRPSKKQRREEPVALDQFKPEGDEPGLDARKDAHVKRSTNSKRVWNEEKLPPINIGTGVGLLLLVTDQDNKPLKLDRATEIKKQHKDKFWLPLISNEDEPSLIVEYALIDKVRMRDIEGMDFDEESYAQDVIGILGSDIIIVKTLSTDYVEKILKTEEISNYNESTRLFVGDSAPSAEQLREKGFSTLDIGDLRIHYGVCSTAEFGDMIPLSWSFFQTKLQLVKVPHLVTEILKKAVGLSGSFLGRKTTLARGFCSFIGERSGVSASIFFRSAFLSSIFLSKHIAIRIRLSQVPLPVPAL